MRVGVLTVSDRASSGAYEDLSGPEAVRILRAALDLSEEDIVTRVVPDARTEIEDTLREWSGQGELELVFTNGGTGISPRDVTPQATLAVLDYEVPGIAELMRQTSLAKTPMAALSRAVAGVRGRTLIINLPGSPKAVAECLQAVLPILPHALDQLQGGQH